MPNSTNDVELDLAPINPTVPNQIDQGYKPPDYEKISSKPQVWDTTTYSIPDKDFAVRLRQGIVCEITINGYPYMLQNINDNEDDVLEFSFHGNPDGIWNRLEPANLVQVNRTIWFLNRTNKDVLYLAVARIEI